MKAVPCDVILEHNEIRFRFSFKSLKELGIDTGDIKRALDQYTWSEEYDKVISLINQNIMNTAKNRYQQQDPAVSWENWDWYAMQDETQYDSVDVCYSDYTQYLENSEEFQNLINEITETIENVLAAKEKGHESVSFCNDVEAEDESLAYSFVALSMQELVDLCRQLKVIGISKSCLYSNKASEYILEITQELSKETRRKMTNIIQGEHNIAFLSKRDTQLTRAYAEEHDKFIVKNDAVGFIIYECTDEFE